MAKDYVEDAIDKGQPRKPAKAAPRVSYKVYPETKIPVSSVIGKLHHAKISNALAKREAKGTDEAWEQAIQYYHNDQLGHRNTDNPDKAGNRNVAQTHNHTFSETENVVFSNVNSIVPVLYAKNPQMEFTSDSNPKIATLLERLVNNIIIKKTNPGVNLKPKAKRAVVISTLTNKAWFEVGYTRRNESSETAMQEIQSLSEKFIATKDVKELREIEGQLAAIDLKIDLLQPSGPFVNVHTPDKVIFDVAAELPDGSDGSWIAVKSFIQSDLLQAVYYKKDAHGKEVSIFESTHLLASTKANVTGVEQDINNFTLFNTSEDIGDYKKFGFADEFTFRKAQFTQVWKVWDKVTRRVYLYNADDFSWPIWVWNDPYQLEGFYPLTALVGYTDPINAESKGEVTYYLDQQDAINEMNDHERRLRNKVKNKLIYNKNVITKAEVEKYLKAGDDVAVGIDAEKDVDINKAITAPVNDAVKYLQVLFDPAKKFQAFYVMLNLKLIRLIKLLKIMNHP